MIITELATLPLLSERKWYGTIPSDNEPDTSSIPKCVGFSILIRDMVAREALVLIRREE